MKGFAALVLVATLSANVHAAEPTGKAADPVELEFVLDRTVPVDLAYGLDAIDAEPRLYGARTSASFAPGQKTVWYTCPGAPSMHGGTRLTYTFEAGERYALVCQGDGQATIRREEAC